MNYEPYAEFPYEDLDLMCPICGYDAIEVDEPKENPTRQQCYCPRCGTEDTFEAFLVGSP